MPANSTPTSEAIAGHHLEACQRYGCVWIAREQLLALRDTKLDHPILSAQRGRRASPPKAALWAVPTEAKRCPSCDMDVF